MSCPGSYDCSLSDENVPFEADPDIAGLGVVLAFAITAWSTFALMLAIYLGSVVEKTLAAARLKQDWLLNEAQSQPGNVVPSLELLFLKELSRAGQPTGSEQERALDIPDVSGGFRKLGAVLADQQSITGASILLVAVIQHCTITQYHFQIALYLSWLNLPTLYFTMRLAGDEYRGSRFMTAWRSVWYCCLNVLVLVANVVSFNAAFLLDGGFGISMQCVWRRTIEPGPIPVLLTIPSHNLTLAANATTTTSSTVGEGLSGNSSITVTTYLEYPQYWTLSLVYLVYIVILQVFLVLEVLQSLYNVQWSWYSKGFDFLLSLLYTPLYFDMLLVRAEQSLRQEGGGQAPSTGSQNLALCARILLLILRVLNYPVAGLVVAIGTILSSAALELLVNGLVLLVTTINLTQLRADASGEGMIGSEDEWGFGQVLPLLLIALPVTAYLDAVKDVLRKRFAKNSGGTLSSSASSTTLQRLVSSSSAASSLSGTDAAGVAVASSQTESREATLPSSTSRQVRIRPPEASVSSSRRAIDDYDRQRFQLRQRNTATLEMGHEVHSPSTANAVPSEKKASNLSEEVSARARYLQQSPFVLLLLVLIPIALTIFTIKTQYTL